MHKFPCQIFPKSGYKNEQFIVRNDWPDLSFKFEILDYEGNSIRSGQAVDTTYIILEPFSVSGMYRLSYQFEGRELTEYFQVIDSIRLGSSVIKAVYAFDNLDVLFFVMKDRIRFYDEKEKFSYEENRCSPSDIIRIDKEYFLFITDIGHKKGITNYAAYSFTRSQINFQLLDCYHHLHFDTVRKWLWVTDNRLSKLECYYLDHPEKEKILPDYSLSFDTIGKIEHCNTVFCRRDEVFTIVDLDIGEVSHIQLSGHTIIDINCETGYELGNNAITYWNIRAPKKRFTVSLAEPPGLNPVDYEWAGRAIVKEKTDSETEFDVLQAAASRQYPADQGHKGNYQAVALPTQITEQTFHFKTYRLIGNGPVLLFAYAQVSCNIERLIYRKDHSGGWKVDPDIRQIWTYDILRVENGQFNSLEHSKKAYEPLFSSNGRLFIRNGDRLLLMIDGEIRHIFDHIDYPAVKISRQGPHEYLVASNFDNFSIYRMEDFQPVITRTAVLNYQHFEQHGKLIYNIKTPNKQYLEGYDLLTGKLFALKDDPLWRDHGQAGKKFIFELDFYQNCDGVLIDPYTLAQKNGLLGELLAVSKQLNKAVTRRGAELYLSVFNENAYISTDIEFPIVEYDEAFLSPDGHFLVLQKEMNAYSLYDITSQTEINFFSGKFLAFNREGQLIVEKNKSRAVVIYDPLTMQEVTPANYQYYLFRSPDGGLYADLSESVRFYDRVQKRFISQEECRALRIELGNLSSTLNSALAVKITANRQNYFFRNQTKPHWNHSGFARRVP